ncbi:MAG: phosphotransferase [Actinobacteria bacterium]|nr:MAG: phosphotransferase [Actinomycetota bacterium]
MTPDARSCVIVTGMPGAGKSTVAGLAARLLPKAAQVRGDDMNQMIKSGYVGWMGKPADEALRQDELCNRNMCSLANNFIDFGFTVLMDTVLADRAELDFFLALLSPRPVRLVVLAPGSDVCRHRNATRDPDDRFDFDEYEQLEADMNREFGDAGWWFDTSALKPDETAERLVAEVPDRTTPLAAGWHTWLRRLHDVEPESAISGARRAPFVRADCSP